MHILPQLHGLEEKYKGRLVVLGIHSAKFSAEQADSKIRQAIRRFGITHAVLNDYASLVWDLYGVQGWPTLVLIDPKGRIVGAVSGEGHIDEVDAAIAQLLKNDVRDLSAAPMPTLETKPKSRQGLAFPSKLLVDEARNRLFVADSGHQRILICSLSDGKFLDCIGSGESGFQNGSFAQASFRNPQGLALSADGNTLFVADTENHALRALDLRARRVATLAGDGKQGSAFDGGGKGQRG